LKSDARASLDDLAIRWETPRGREIKAEILQDIRHNKGERLPEVLKDFIYVSEVPDGRDLRCITLEDMDLGDTTWKGCDLSWASFARSTLTRADFRSANLKRANLADANVSLGRFAEADCARADFSRGNLEHANFKEAKMNGAVFVGANCARASFDTANLVKCNFVGAVLEQASFANADCNNGNFSGSAMDTLAAKPSKAWGIVYDMSIEEFERKVGLNSLTSRTTKKFKGLDVLLKASAALAKIQKKTATIAVPDDLALGAPAGMKRLETFKRPEDEGGVVFGATLRRKKDDGPEPPSDVATAADYLEEAQSFDPDDPTGANAEAEQQAALSDSGETLVNDEAVGAVWTDGVAEESEPPEAPYHPPVAQPTPASQPRPSAPAPAPGTGPRPTRPVGAPPGGPPSGKITRPPGATPISAQPPSSGAYRVTKPLGPPPAQPGAAPGPPRPAGAPAAPGAPPSARVTRPLGPAGGPPAGPTGTPAIAAPRSPTKSLSRPPSGITMRSPFPPGTAPPAPAAPAPVAAPAPAPAPVAPSFVAPLDPSAPDPTADWAKAIGQLMQSKSSITKIVIETGDKSRVLFKKP
jgi:uncharacterized protein YjbI with pentapeptide repeats